MDKLDNYLKLNKKIITKDKDCCDNPDIIDTKTYLVCRNCSIINPYIEEPEFNKLGAFEYINDIFPNQCQETRCFEFYNYKYRRLFYIHKTLNVSNKELRMRKILDNIYKHCKYYNINDKIAYQAMYIYKSYYVDKKIIFGGKIRMLMEFYSLNEVLKKKNMKVLSIFEFIERHQITWWKYNYFLDKIDSNKCRLGPNIIGYYKKMIKYYKIKITLKTFIIQYNLFKNRYKDYKRRKHQKSIILMVIYNYILLFNKPHCLKQMAKQFGVSPKTFYSLKYDIKHHWKFKYNS